jgi:hypothetical protein
MKKIIFVSHNNNIGSDNLRVMQIVNILKNNYDIEIISQFYEGTWNIKSNLYDELKKYNNVIFVWVWSIDINIINKLKCMNTCNIHIYDLVDKYIYDTQKINNILNLNYLDGIIVNNKYMKNYIYQNTLYNKDIYVIYHQYDLVYETAILSNQDKLIFGYMGSIPSLKHTQNFMYFEKLIKIYDIELLNTENKKYYKNIDSEIIKSIKSSQVSLDFIPIKFNCHISLRETYSDIFRFKTTAKIATASFFGHNIITTWEEAVKDVLPENYPFIIKDDSFESICKMFDLIIEDYNNEKKLWNFGLSLMNQVKHKLSINNITNEYINMFNKYK